MLRRRLEKKAVETRLIGYLHIWRCGWLSRHCRLLRRSLNWLSNVIQSFYYFVEPFS
jgi:hypothetical protein